MRRRFFLSGIFLYLSFLASVSGQDVNFNDLARFVAGKPVSSSSPLNQIMGSPSVRKHYAETTALSQKWKEARLSKIQEWAAMELQPQLTRPTTVKYMFGGPDFVHVASIFPGVPEYILAGLEPLGSIPDFFSMDEVSLDSYLTHLNYTLRSISRRNFFITTEMREDFGKEGIDGVFPVLLYFAALTGHDVLNANYVKLEPGGSAVLAAPDEATGIWLRIRQSNPGANVPQEQNLYYFKTDLSNNGFKGGSSFHQFLSARPDSVSYLKAASFLMHQEDFTNIRNFIVGDSKWILQDASGVPAEFLSRYFNLTFYGNYTGPIDMFSEYNQPWLHDVYRSGIAKPLPFGTGYRMKDSDSIQIFGVRK
ncbi:MAG: hypothetical protein P1U68_09980 [Verrucomicrobiales bacterium]|nr:hypothetical protein [Verrucomicrobiales bacterium]